MKVFVILLTALILFVGCSKEQSTNIVQKNPNKFNKFTQEDVERAMQAKKAELEKLPPNDPGRPKKNQLLPPATEHSKAFRLSILKYPKTINMYSNRATS